MKPPSPPERSPCDGVERLERRRHRVVVGDVEGEPTEAFGDPGECPAESARVRRDEPIVGRSSLHDDAAHPSASSPRRRGRPRSMLSDNLPARGCRAAVDLLASASNGSAPGRQRRTRRPSTAEPAATGSVVLRCPGHPHPPRDRPAERAELGDEARHLRLVERVVPDDRDAVAPAERLVGVGPEPRRPLGAVGGNGRSSEPGRA